MFTIYKSLIYNDKYHYPSHIYSDFDTLVGEAHCYRLCMYILSLTHQRGFGFLRTKLTYNSRMPENFHIKQYIWLIILVVFTAILSADTSFEYALGVISANVLRDGVILTLLVFTFSYFYRKKSWSWFDWLNVIAYTTVIASFLKPIIQEFRYQGYDPDLGRIIIVGVIVAFICYRLLIKKRNKTKNIFR